MTEQTSAPAQGVQASAHPTVPVDAIVNLVNHQEQCDMDGVMVKVSRQALAEVLVYVTEVRPDNKWADKARSPAPATTGDGAPVAWQWRYVGNTEWCTPSGGIRLDDETLKRERPIEQRPLYAELRSPAECFDVQCIEDVDMRELLSAKDVGRGRAILKRILQNARSK